MFKRFGRAKRSRALAATLGALTVSNVVSNRVLSAGSAVVWNIGMSAALLAVARRAGLTDRELGLGRSQLRDGTRVGLLGAAGIAGLFGVLLSGSGTRRVFDDDRAGNAGTVDLLHAVLVRIPLGTVILEEVAFRGVLPALLGRELRGCRPAAVASLLFGIWHILPSRELGETSDVMGQAAARRGAPDPVLLAVVTTAAGGFGLQEARRLGGHVVAPALIHLTSNILGFVIAWGLPRHRARVASGTRADPLE